MLYPLHIYNSFRSSSCEPTAESSECADDVIVHALLTSHIPRFEQIQNGVNGPPLFCCHRTSASVGFWILATPMLFRVAPLKKMIVYPWRSLKIREPDLRSTKGNPVRVLFDMTKSWCNVGFRSEFRLPSEYGSGCSWCPKIITCPSIQLKRNASSIDYSNSRSNQTKPRMSNA